MVQDVDRVFPPIEFRLPLFSLSEFPDRRSRRRAAAVPRRGVATVAWTVAQSESETGRRLRACCWVAAPLLLQLLGDGAADRWEGCGGGWGGCGGGRSWEAGVLGGGLQFLEC